MNPPHDDQLLDRPAGGHAAAGASPTARRGRGPIALWVRLAGWIVYTPWTAWTLVAINLTSAIIGYVYWYGDAILESPVYLWPFVPDSPLSATLWALALLAVHYRVRIPILGLLAVTGSIKYGLWTDWVWLTNAYPGGGYDLEAVVLSLNHFGMVLEGLLLLPFIRFSLAEVAFVAAWYGTNDLFDYGFGRRPRLPNPEDEGLIAAFAVTTTAVLTAVWLVLAGRRRTRPAAH